MTNIQIEATGTEEAERKARQIARDLQGSVFLEGMRKATLIVTRDAKIKAPVDTGRLRSSITPEVRHSGKQFVGVVGTNVFYAPFVELGTVSHFVSGEHIGRWAERHGFGFGGLFVSGEAQPFLEPAFEENITKIVDILGATVTGIVEK